MLELLRDLSQSMAVIADVMPENEGIVTVQNGCLDRLADATSALVQRIDNLEQQMVLQRRFEIERLKLYTAGRVTADLVHDVLGKFIGDT